MPIPFNRIFIRINKYTPAVTNVDEWTRAEIGVGAEKGIWTLLAQAEIIIIIVSSNRENLKTF